MELKWAAIMVAVVLGLVAVGEAVDRYGKHQVEIAKIQKGDCK